MSFSCYFVAVFLPLLILPVLGSICRSRSVCLVYGPLMFIHWLYACLSRDTCLFCCCFYSFDNLVFCCYFSMVVRLICSACCASPPQHLRVSAFVSFCDSSWGLSAKLTCPGLSLYVFAPAVFVYCHYCDFRLSCVTVYPCPHPFSTLFTSFACPLPQCTHPHPCERIRDHLHTLSFLSITSPHHACILRKFT